MKVESSPDVQTVQQLDKPAVSQTSTSAPVPGLDELAHLFSLEVQNNSQPLSQRKMSVRVPPAEQLAQIYDQLGHPAQATLATLASLSRRIRLQLLQHPHVDKLLELAGGDPARAFVVLKYVATQADAEVRPSEAALARDAIAKLEVRFKGQIQAGLNIALALQAGSADPQERQALRALYYASVVTRQSLATMMQALLGVYGGERLADGLNMMRKALVDDIAAKVSSLPTPLLRSLLQGLQSCGQLSGVLSGCNALLQRLGIDHDAVSLLQRLLGYAGAGIAAAEILRLGSDLSGSSNVQQLLALNALYPLVQQLPLAIWLDGRVREETLRGFLTVMGELDRMTRGPARSPGKLGIMA